MVKMDKKNKNQNKMVKMDQNEKNLRPETSPSKWIKMDQNGSKLIKMKGT